MKNNNSTNGHYVFVYGTLKHGYGNHDIIKDSVYEGEAFTVERYPMYGAGLPFPYLVDMVGEGDTIYGELYRVDDETVQALDWLEGVPTLYHRKQIQVQPMECQDVTVMAYVYFQSNPPDNVLEYDLISEFV